jgi:predicted dehydrogenase
MTETLRWGILATGGIAESFAKDLKLTGRPIAAVGSRSLDKAEAFAGRHGIAKAHGSYEELAADPEVDAIYVATPHPMHAENAMLALNHGKHVLVEKSFTVNAKEAKQVVDLAEAKGLVALEAMWTRFLPHMIRIREIVASGILGEVRSVVAEHMQDLPDDPKHRLNDLALGGGALLDLGIYPMSFIWDMLGPPELLYALGRFRATGADAQVAAVFRHEGGAMSSMLCASDTAGPNRAHILGTEGRIEIDGVWYKPTTFRVIDSKHNVLETYESTVEGRGMQYQAAELERLVAAGLISGEMLPARQSVAIMAVLDEIRGQIGLSYPGEL